MTLRDRRALLLGGLAVGLAVLGLRVLPWLIRRGSMAYSQLEEHATLLARTRDELATLSELRDSTAVLTRALVALAPQVLSGSTAAEAGADLSGRINLAASRAPARVERLEAMPDSSSDGRLGRARVHAAFETDVRGVVAFLRAIDAGEGVLTLDELRVVTPDPGAPDRGPEILKIEVTVSGWYIKTRDAGNGKRET